MATIRPVPTSTGTIYGHSHVVVWSTITSADTPEAYEMTNEADRSIQIEGTPDSATVAVQGSNDGTNYHTLTDPLGVALSINNTTALKQITEVTRYIKPVVSGGGGSQSLTITLCERGSL